MSSVNTDEHEGDFRRSCRDLGRGLAWALLFLAASQLAIAVVFGAQRWRRWSDGAFIPLVLGGVSLYVGVLLLWILPRPTPALPARHSHPRPDIVRPPRGRQAPAKRKLRPSSLWASARAQVGKFRIGFRRDIDFGP